MTAPGSAASDRAALLLSAVWALATAALLATPVGPLGVRILAAVVLWHGAVVAVGVPTWGPLAVYVLPAEALLAAATVWADQITRERSLLARLAVGGGVVLAYVGALAVGWLLLGR